MRYPIDVHKVFAAHFKGSETLAYALSSRLEEGHICIDIEDYKKELPTLLEEQRSRELFSEEDQKYWVCPAEFELQCKNDAHVSTADGELKPFRVHLGKAYLQRYFSYETSIIKNLERLDKLKIITGGPGSGKTTSVSTTLAELLDMNKNLRIAMAAPTGKAAARMNQAIRRFALRNEGKIPEQILTHLTSLKATTIHKLLGTIPNSVFFRHDEKNPLPWDVLVIDECSMIDGAMMAKLLNAVDKETRIFLLGDKDQLASVEAGSVFGDLCQAKEAKVLKGKVEVKTESHRFKVDSGIGKLSKDLINEELQELESYSDNDEVEIDFEYNKDKFRSMAKIFEQYITEPDPGEALNKINLIRFLCVTRQNEQSVSDTNRKIEAYLNSVFKGKEDFKSSEGFYHNQVVMITRNDSVLKVNNGDIALIRKDEKGSLIAYLESEDEKPREIPAGYLNYWETAYAMTIHKSQGSEFENVLLILPEKKAGKMLTKELIYTGITRASEKVLIQTNKELMLESAKRKVSRTSGLQQRLLTD